MRIIAGQAKGKRIAIPPHSAIRPTSDRVREAIFNALFSLGGVEAKLVVDVFAGSGALGLEALSRGASHAVFIEQDSTAARILRGNIQALAFQEQATIIKSDALTWLGEPRVPTQKVLPPPVLRDEKPSSKISDFEFDIAFCDPPYDFKSWDKLLASLNCRWLVAESNRKLELNSLWKIHKFKRYGTTFISIAEKFMSDSEMKTT